MHVKELARLGRVSSRTVVWTAGGRTLSVGIKAAGDHLHQVVLDLDRAARCCHSDGAEPGDLRTGGELLVGAGCDGEALVVVEHSGDLQAATERLDIAAKGRQLHLAAALDA